MSDKIPVVDIGVACSKMTSPDWWSPVMALIVETERSGVARIGNIRTVSSALPDANKNNTVGQVKKRWSLTDANRNEIANKGFLNEDADYIFWMDDDTVPPPGTIAHLINLRRPFVAGLYFLPKKPYNPIAYLRHEDSGLYYALYNYQKGALIEVDSVGMGCTLIHRSVYEQIRDGHTVFERYNGALIPVPNSQVMKPFIAEHKRRQAPYVRAGVYHEQVKPKDENDDRNFPFYLLEHGRTEDHYFCELAANVGIRPMVDTSITCQHWKMNDVTEEEYIDEIEKAEGILQ